MSFSYILFYGKIRWNMLLYIYIFPNDRWLPLIKDQLCGPIFVFYPIVQISCWTNSSITSELRHHNAHMTSCVYTLECHNTHFKTKIKITCLTGKTSKLAINFVLWKISWTEISYTKRLWSTDGIKPIVLLAIFPWLLIVRCCHVHQQCLQNFVFYQIFG